MPTALGRDLTPQTAEYASRDRPLDARVYFYTNLVGTPKDRVPIFDLGYDGFGTFV